MHQWQQLQFPESDEDLHDADQDIPDSDGDSSEFESVLEPTVDV